MQRAILAIVFFAAGSAWADDAAYLRALYEHLHRNPELSFHEEETAARIAEELREAGMEVTENIGGYGVVGVYTNGEGPTVMLRGDTDALPVTEETGLPYASQVTTTDDQGNTVGVMHACGHDIHMTTLVGAARRLLRERDAWSGTLVAIAQPAEERSGGANAMLADGLFERFPRPDAAIALHVKADMAAGRVGYRAGYSMANVDMVDVTVFGVGGHGAYPHTTKDPIVLAAQIVNGWQTLVSRTISPLESGVVTVGSFHAGTKHNIISDRVHMQLTVRSYSDETRRQLLDGIRRIAEGHARAAGIDEGQWPQVDVRDETTPAVYNDPELVERVAAALKEKLGVEQVVETEPVMGGEDFAKYGRVEPTVPIMMMWLGAVDPDKIAAARERGEGLPSLHSAAFAPLPDPAIATGVEALVTAALTEFGGG